MRILHLYRPRVPTVRAQAIQVVHTCHALARRGHTVTLFADVPGPDDPDALGAGVAWSRATDALAAYGLDHPPTFDLQLAPSRHPTLAGIWFRWARAGWRGDLVYARAKRYVASSPEGVPVVLEVHEVDSALAEEAGRDGAADRRLESAALTRAAGVVANGAGTLELLATRHPLPSHRRVIWNATRADRVVARHPSAAVRVGYTGSPRDWKGFGVLLESVAAWPEGVDLELVGGGPPGLPRVHIVPPVPYGDLPARLATYHALVLPLADNLYGRRLANPLKLWDYLATGIPIVAADLPTVREVAGDLPHYFRPGDPASLADAVRRALAAGSSPVRLRTWDDRAAEIEAFLDEVRG